MRIKYRKWYVVFGLLEHLEKTMLTVLPAQTCNHPRAQLHCTRRVQALPERLAIHTSASREAPVETALCKQYHLRKNAPRALLAHHTLGKGPRSQCQPSPKPRSSATASPLFGHNGSYFHLWVCTNPQS